jgi:hypothetical protein
VFNPLLRLVNLNVLDTEPASPEIDNKPADILFASLAGIDDAPLTTKDINPVVAVFVGSLIFAEIEIITDVPVVNVIVGVDVVTLE